MLPAVRSKKRFPVVLLVTGDGGISRRFQSFFPAYGWPAAHSHHPTLPHTIQRNFADPCCKGLGCGLFCCLRTAPGRRFYDSRRSWHHAVVHYILFPARGLLAVAISLVKRRTSRRFSATSLASREMRLGRRCVGRQGLLLHSATMIRFGDASILTGNGDRTCGQASGGATGFLFSRKPKNLPQQRTGYLYPTRLDWPKKLGWDKEH